ncbi:hypothetical protein LUX29_04045 [Aureimonas altamirensis]|nr:hypothetical protein [Aureimonas altamirensis]UHD47966.1 hypothetical protein LUX29_04045 [Aureimonas altamirensis]
MSAGVSFRVNGEERRIDLDLRTTLLDTIEATGEGGLRIGALVRNTALAT